MVKPKAVVLFSGGLDSRLVVKLMQQQGFEVEAVNFKLPFGCGCCNDVSCSMNFTQLNKAKFVVFDCFKGKLLEEYLEILKHPRHGRGVGMNPCIDCKIFMFKKAKEYADSKNIKIIATGEVLGQRPMSQTMGALKIIDKEIGFEIKRPLIELGMQGRQRKKQMELAEKFKIKYPAPAGGCLLCEKNLKNRLKILLKENKINEESVELVSVGRHFFKDNCWFIVARNEKESLIIEKHKNHLESDTGRPAVFYETESTDNLMFANRLQKAYEDRKPERVGEWKI